MARYDVSCGQSCGSYGTNEDLGMSRLLAPCAVGVFLAFAAPARAQICAGQAPFVRYALQLSGSAAFGDTGTAFGAGLGLGGHKLFVETGLSRTSYPNNGGARGTLSLQAGYDMPLGTRQVFHVCPLIRGEFGFGPHNVNIFAGVPGNLDEDDWIVGLSAGAQTAPSGMRVIPTASLSFVERKTMVKDNIVDNETSQWKSFELLDLGLGVMLNEKVTVLPGVTVPLGLAGGSPMFRLTVSVKVPEKPPVIR